MKFLFIISLIFLNQVYAAPPLPPALLELIDLSSRNGYLIRVNDFSKDEFSDWEEISSSSNSPTYASVRVRPIDSYKFEVQWRVSSRERDLSIAIINKFYSACPPSIYRCYSVSSPRLSTKLGPNSSFIFPTYTISFRDENQELIDISDIKELYICNFNNEIPSQFHFC